MVCVLLGFGVLLAVLAGVVLAWLAGAGLTGLGVLAFQLRYLQAQRDAGRPVGKLELLRFHLGEARAYVTLGWWHVRALPVESRRVPPDAVGEPVLLVHGYTQNSTNMWGLQRALFAAGRPSERVFLGLSYPWRRVEDYAHDLTAAIERHPQGVWVVAHSLGGIVLREVLTKRADLRSHVVGVVT
ncbi:MAG: alpha/beta hydrolase, partial [Myxococcales bacterium]|nr:alpha/beta hydrolase [Myxococcales bacterium]